MFSFVNSTNDNYVENITTTVDVRTNVLHLFDDVRTNVLYLIDESLKLWFILNASIYISNESFMQLIQRVCSFDFKMTPYQDMQARIHRFLIFQFSYLDTFFINF